MWMKETNLEPPTVSQVLQEHFLKLDGVTQQSLADAMGVHRHTVSELMNDRRSITALMALRLGQVLGTDPEFWMNLQQERDLFEARRKFGSMIAALQPLRETVREDQASQPFEELFPGAKLPDEMCPHDVDLIRRCGP
jgi:addiction module HigA family antidote